MRKPRAKKETYTLARDDDGRFRRAGVLARLFTRRVVVKRDCATGRFVAPSTRALGCEIKDRPRQHWTAPQPGDRSDRVCYRTRAEALRAFVHWNRRIVEEWTLDNRSTGGEFDAVNEKYGLRGKRRVATLAGAIQAAMPTGKPYCLDRFDLGVLNDTRPGQDLGPFVLPDVVEEHKLYEKYEREGAFGSECADCDVPF